MFARFDENPAMTLQDIKEAKRYGRTHGRRDGRTHGRENSIPTTNKVCGGYKYMFLGEISKFVTWLVSSKRYKVACVPIKDSDQPAHPQSDQSSMAVLWVAKGLTFLQAEN